MYSFVGTYEDANKILPIQPSYYGIGNFNKCISDCVQNGGKCPLYDTCRIKYDVVRKIL